MAQSIIDGSARLLFSVAEVAVMFGLSTKSVRRLLDRGHLKSSGALRHKMITKASIEAFLAACT
jgi:hypothetical protein